MLNIELSKVANSLPGSHMDTNLMSARSKLSQDRKGTAASTAMQTGHPLEGSSASTKRLRGHLESGSDRFADQINE